MSLLIKGALLIVAIASTSQAWSVTSYSRQWNIPASSGKSLVGGTLFIADSNGYPYASCETTKPDVEKVCNVTLVKPGSKDRTCNGVKIFTSEENRELFYNGYFQVIPFTQDHVIVAWYDTTKKSAPEKKNNFKVSILNLNSCSINHLDFPIDNSGWGYFPALLLYPTSVDVIVNSKATCGRADKCRVNYDLEGKQIGNIQPYQPKIIGYANPVSAAAPEKGFFEYVSAEKTLTVLLVNAAGEGKELSETNYEAEADAYKQRISSSNAHELYGICRVPDLGDNKPTNVYCNQFDATGKTTLSATVPISNKAGWLAVRNVPGGGLVLAVPSDKKVQIYRIRGDGQYDKPTEISISEIECTDSNVNLSARLSENEKDQICLDISCSASTTNLKYISKCASKSKVY